MSDEPLLPRSPSARARPTTGNAAEPVPPKMEPTAKYTESASVCPCDTSWAKNCCSRSRFMNTVPMEGTPRNPMLRSISRMRAGFSRSNRWPRAALRPRMRVRSTRVAKAGLASPSSSAMGDHTRASPTASTTSVRKYTVAAPSRASAARVSRYRSMRYRARLTAALDWSGSTSTSRSCRGPRPRAHRYSRGSMVRMPLPPRANTFSVRWSIPDFTRSVDIWLRLQTGSSGATGSPGCERSRPRRDADPPRR